MRARLAEGGAPLVLFDVGLGAGSNALAAWRASAAVAQTHHIPVLPHYYKEYDVPLLLTVPNAYGAESFDWVDPLITQPIRRLRRDALQDRGEAAAAQRAAGERSP